MIFRSAPVICVRGSFPCLNVTAARWVGQCSRESPRKLLCGFTMLYLRHSLFWYFSPQGKHKQWLAEYTARWQKWPDPMSSIFLRASEYGTTGTGVGTRRKNFIVSGKNTSKMLAQCCTMYVWASFDYGTNHFIYPISFQLSTSYCNLFFKAEIL